MRSTVTRGLVAAFFGFAAAAASAAFVNPSLPGTSEFEGWEDLTFMNFNQSDYGGGFPGAGPWIAPISGNAAGSEGNAGYNKVSGNGYPAGVSVYAPFTDSVFEIESSGPLGFDIGTIIFQIDIGPGTGFEHLSAAPTLSLNGGSQALAADFTSEAPGAFPFTNPVNPAETGTTTAFQFQWDLSSLGSVTQYEIQWTTIPHAQTYKLQLDVGDTFTQVIPEPTSLALIGVVAAATLAWRRRQ